jgi:hypothetical protein
MSSGGSAHKHELILWATSDGAAAERRGDWPGAVAAYREAADLQEELFEAQTTRMFAERKLGDVPDLTSRLAYAHIRAGQLNDALIAVEVGRARLLTSAALLSDPDLDVIEDPGLRGQIARTVQQMRYYEQARVNPNWTATVASGTQIKALRAEMKRLQSLPGARQLALPSVEALRQNAAERAVICLCAGEAGGAALVVPADPDAQLEAILLPDAALAAIAVRAKAIADVTKLLKEDPRAAFEGIDACCNWISSAAIGPIMQRVAIRRITFIATSWFSLMPLRAAWHSISDGTGRRYPLDDVSVCSIPNLRVLSRVQRQLGPLSAASVLIVADPAADSEQALPSARSEAHAVRRLLPSVSSFIGQEATRGVVVRKLPHCAIAHFACHALSNVGQPLESGVQLAGGQWLRVHDIMQLSLPKAPYVVLSACETAGIGRSAPDEGVGLPAAFLQAGATGVIASSWSVSDDSTSLLMVRLYDEMQRTPHDLALALSRAQTWLRGASPQLLKDAARQYGMEKVEVPQRPTPYAHPFFWAAFGYTG